MGCDLSEWYQDRTGRVCPDCQDGTEIFYKVLPESRLIYETVENGRTHKYTEHMGQQRDYKCKNCDTVWLMNHGGSDGA